MRYRADIVGLRALAGVGISGDDGRCTRELIGHCSQFARARKPVALPPGRAKLFTSRIQRIAGIGPGCVEGLARALTAFPMRAVHSKFKEV
jgi:hypothetical protein